MQRRLELVGWIVFFIGSLLFATHSLLAQDYFGAGASFTFTLGCLLFIIAFFKEDRR